jgi:hypothetical protein
MVYVLVVQIVLLRLAAPVRLLGAGVVRIDDPGALVVGLLEHHQPPVSSTHAMTVTMQKIQPPMKASTQLKSLSAR